MKRYSKTRNSLEIEIITEDKILSVTIVNRDKPYVWVRRYDLTVARTAREYFPTERTYDRPSLKEAIRTARRILKKGA